MTRPFRAQDYPPTDSVPVVPPLDRSPSTSDPLKLDPLTIESGHDVFAPVDRRRVAVAWEGQGVVTG
jgi:hypothetical protein